MEQARSEVQDYSPATYIQILLYVAIIITIGGKSTV